MKIFYFLILVLINCVTGFPQEPIKLWFGNGYDGVKGANGAQEPNKRWFGNGYDGVKGANGAAGSSTTTVMSNLETITNFYTTSYTYFKTITVDGTASVQTSTDIYSQINTEAIPIGVVTPVTEILPTSSATNSLIDTRQTEESIDAIEVTTVQTETTKNDGEEDTDSITTETPGLTEEVTEVSTTATTESSEQELDAESIIVAPRTVYTTYTYLTTLFKGTTTTVMSNLETITNIATDGIIQPTLIEASGKFYTTFTYWTTSVDGSETITTSIEETLTNILAGSAAYTSVIEAALPGLSGEEINATPPTNSFIEQTAFTFPTTSITEDLDGSEEISTVVPVLQSSEGEKSVFDTLATSTQFSLTSQLRGSSIPISTSAFGAASESINPSSVLQRGSKTFSSELVESTTSPTVFIRPIELNKPNPFKARLKELQQDRLRQLQEANKINNDKQISYYFRSISA